VSSTDPTIDVSWSASTDVGSGLDGYGYVFDNSPAWTCDQVKDVEEGVTTATSASLAPGSWYVHVCARDNAGNWSSAAHAGPYTIATATTGRSLHTIAPCRLVDTREPSGAPALAAGVDRTFDASASCGIPATARALSVNVTVVSPTAPGHLTFFPTGGAAPVTSTVNFGLGQTRANNAILTLGSTAGFTVRSGQATGSVHLLVDVNGYFE
jgi:hypothetical protein